MKKSLLALAVLSAFAGAASAQSSVTISGSVDAAVRAVGSEYSIGQATSSYNQIQIAGREDLGGGMAAFFVLQHRFNINNGTSNTSTGNPGGFAGDQFWRSIWLGLGGRWGDVRLGRMLMPLQAVGGGNYDAFDGAYIGGTNTGGLTATLRANHQIQYRSPNIAGFTFAAAIAAAQGQYVGDTLGNLANGPANYSIPTADLNKERPMGFSVQWASGPFSVAAAFDENTAGYETYGLYGKYDFGFMQLFGQWEHGAVNNTAGTAYEKGDIWSVSTRIPMGAITWKLGYAQIASDRANGDAYKVGAGLEYALSKRTSLYSTIGQAGGDRVTGTAEDVRYDIGMTHRF